MLYAIHIAIGFTTTTIIEKLPCTLTAGVKTAGVKLRSSGVKGFSTEGREGRLRTDEGPKAATVNSTVI